MPSDRHTLTNEVYVNPADLTPGTQFINANGFILTVKGDPAVQQGTLALGKYQRLCLRVSPNAGDGFELPPGGFRPPAAETAEVHLHIHPHSTAYANRAIDYQAFESLLRRTVAGQYITPNQQIYLVANEGKFYCVVTQVIAVAKGETCVSGPIGNDTTLTLFVDDKIGMSLVNIPDSIKDKRQTQILQPTMKDFDLVKLGIGGLKTEFGNVFRRAFASRMVPQSLVKKLGVKHAKGVVLHGPPGTGKTLIARKIGEILNCHEPKIVNGPEVFSKFVGQAEENVRNLFGDAEAEQAAKGDESQLHLIIFDEFDAICKQRGASRDNTGSADNVVNQLLSKIDGVKVLNNVLLIGMTNRLDLIDEAILRPGRFEVKVEIGLPDEHGRQEILQIHTLGMRNLDVLAHDVDIEQLAQETKNFSGAELEGLVRSAQSHAFSRCINVDNPTDIPDTSDIKITRNDFEKALEEVKPMFGRAEHTCGKAMRYGIIGHGREFAMIQRSCADFVRSLKESSRLDNMSVLLNGKSGTGKSAFAAHIAMQTGFPYVKYISSNDWVSYGESQKANLMRKAFDDAAKSPMSVIVLDDIERLIEYSAMRTAYSNYLLQSLLVLLKRPMPEGKKILVIGTCNNSQVMQELEVAECFTAELELPTVGADGVEAVAAELNLTFRSPDDLVSVKEAIPAQGLPVKRLIWLMELAAEKNQLRGVRFAEAILESGRR